MDHSPVSLSYRKFRSRNNTFKMTSEGYMYTKRKDVFAIFCFVFRHNVFGPRFLLSQEFRQSVFRPSDSLPNFLLDAR
jgi:hypothetical protein